MTACEAIKIVETCIPKSLNDNFIVSERSNLIALSPQNLILRKY